MRSPAVEPAQARSAAPSGGLLPSLPPSWLGTRDRGAARTLRKYGEADAFPWLPVEPARVEEFLTMLRPLPPMRLRRRFAVEQLEDRLLPDIAPIGPIRSPDNYIPF